MVLLQLFRQSVRIIGQNPLTWLCAILIVLPSYYFNSILPPIPQAMLLNCMFGLLMQYLYIAASIGFIIIASEPPDLERLTLRRLLIPEGRSFWRFVATLVLLYLVSIPFVVPVALNNYSRAMAEVGSAYGIPTISLWWAVPLAVIAAPFVITVELAMRDVVINRSGVLPAIRRSWPITLRNILLLIVVFMLAYGIRYAVSSLSQLLSSLLLIPLLPFFSILGTRAFIHVTGASNSILLQAAE